MAKGTEGVEIGVETAAVESDRTEGRRVRRASMLVGVEKKMQKLFNSDFFVL